MLTEYNEMNQTKLLSYCGLNLVKHKKIFDDMTKKGLIQRTEKAWGNKTIVNYKITEKGKEFCKAILEPYEEMFPRKDLNKEKLNN